MESREIRLKSRPVGLPDTSNFELATVTLGKPGKGEVLVQNRFLSVDPYMRGRMVDRKSYVPPFALGEALQGGAIGEIVESADPALAPGDIVSSMWGWREAYVMPASTVRKVEVPEGVGMEALLGVLGMPGLTAWAGLTQIGEPKAGETLFVSGGAGAVGSVVAQLGKTRGLRVIATAGSDAKCAWLKAAGIDAAINYRTCGNLLEAVRAAAPKGIDIYFDNVGAEHLEVAIELANPFARLVECGMIANYNATELPPGPRNIMYLVGKSLKMQGFIVTQFQHLEPQFVAEVGGLLREGRLRHAETVVDGIAAAPEAFVGLFKGANTGKMLVRL